MVNAQIVDEGISPPGVIDEGISTPGAIDDGITPPQPQSQPAAPAQQCSPVFKYNQCISCNTSQAVYTDSCDGHFTTGPNQNDSACSSWCQAASAPQAPTAPTCTETRQYNECISCNTSRRVSQDSCGNYKIIIGSQNDSACSNLCPAQSQQPAQQPAAPVSQPAAQPAPECPTPGQAGTVQQSQCANQWTYNDFRVLDHWSDGSPKSIYSEFTGNRRCQGTILCAQPAQSSVCETHTNPDTQCVGNQLCNFNVTYDCHGNRTSRIQTGCQNVVGQCGFNQPALAQGGQNVIVSNNNNNTNNNTNTNTITVQAGGTKEVVREVRTIGNVGIGTSAPTIVAGKELPKTGLPALAWIPLAFLPVGVKMRRFSKIREDFSGHPTFLWENRQYNKNGNN